MILATFPTCYWWFLPAHRPLKGIGLTELGSWTRGFTWAAPLLNAGHTGTGCINLRIRLKIAANRLLGSDTSAIWKQV